VAKPANRRLNYLRMLPRDGTLKEHTSSICKSIHRHFLLLRIDYGPRERMGNSLAGRWLSTVIYFLRAPAVLLRVSLVSCAVVSPTCFSRAVRFITPSINFHLCPKTRIRSADQVACSGTNSGLARLCMHTALGRCSATNFIIHRPKLISRTY
jgi:hypothetical protein